MPFIDFSSLDQRELLPGFRVHMVHSDAMTFAHWDIDAGSELPEHSHPHEQVCNVLEGEFELTIDGETQIVRPGKVAIIPPNAIHAGKAVTACRVLDVFSPVREDYR